MADQQAPRRRGRPPIWGASKRPEYLDRLGADAIRAINEEAFGTPEKRAAEITLQRGQILRAVRKQRHRTPTEATRSKTDRLQRIENALKELRPELSASNCAVNLKKKGFFSDVETGTLRKDIARIRKLARLS